MTQQFSTLTAIAAPLPLANIDTDKILAGRFLKTISRRGLGSKLFHAMRFDPDGNERIDFILNKAPWRDAGILIALENFGCGSSREHAPWALADFGIRCVIAPSFADIFHTNCFKNGILPVKLSRADVDRLMDDAASPATAMLTVDLPAQTVARTNGDVIAFDVTPERKVALVRGLDEIATSLSYLPKIEAWEAARKDVAPPIRASVLLDAKV